MTRNNPVFFLLGRKNPLPASPCSVSFLHRLHQSQDSLRMLSSSPHIGHKVAVCGIFLSFRKCSLYFLILVSGGSQQAAARTVLAVQTVNSSCCLVSKGEACVLTEAEQSMSRARRTRAERISVTVWEVRSHDPPQLPEEFPGDSHCSAGMRLSECSKFVLELITGRRLKALAL